MNSLMRFLQSFLGPEKRKSARYAASKNSHCLVKSKRTEYPISVYLHDISESGAGFFFKNSLFEVGDQVEFHLENDSNVISSLGQIASQRIYYPENTSDLKFALFRYSVQFQKPLDLSTVNSFKNEATP